MSILNKLSIAVAGTPRGAFQFRTYEAYKFYFRLKQDGATYDSVGGKIHFDTSTKVSFVGKDGDRVTNVNPVLWGSSSGGGSPFAFKKNGAVLTTHPAFLDDGYTGDWDLMGSDNKTFEGSIVPASFWKLASILKYGDIMYGYQKGQMGPMHLTTCGNTGSITACPPNETNTFDLYETTPKGVRVAYNINVPYHFSYTLATTNVPAPISSPKLDHTVDSNTCTSASGGVKIAGGLIILEPTLEEEEQEITPVFRNKGLGALQLKIDNVEGKFLQADAVVDQDTVWDTHAAAGSIGSPEDILDPDGAIDNEEGFYIYQPTAGDSDYRSLEAFTCHKKVSSMWQQRWIMVKFDLKVYNVLVNIETGAKMSPTHVATIEDMTIAYQQAATTAAATTATQSAG
jgi:hypothetical protein